MEEQKKVFFRKTIGGFNKRDVQNYIVAAASSHRAALAALQQRVDELENGLEVAEKRISTRQADDDVLLEKINEGASELSRLRSETREKQEKLDSLAEENRALAAESEQKERRLSELLAEIRSLQEAGARYSEEVSELERNKSYLVELELEARRRADESDARAREHINELRRSMANRFAQAIVRFDAFKSESDMLTERGIEQFRQMAEAHKNLAQALLDTRETFGNMIDELEKDDGFGGAV